MAKIEPCSPIKFRGQGEEKELAKKRRASGEVKEEPKELVS